MANRGRRAVHGLGPGFALLLAFWFVAVSAYAQTETGTRVVVVLSDAAPTYREVADAFVGALGGRFPAQVRLLGELGQDEIRALNNERILLVPVGVRALRGVHAVTGHTARILSLLVPQAGMLALKEVGSDDSAVYIDQPPARSMALVRLMLPRARKVGVIASSAAAGLRELAAEAERAGLEVMRETAEDQDELVPALQRLLPQVDVLLLLPDANVVNEGSVRHILVASYRQRIPVIGFSRGLANAGTVAALVTSPAEIGRQGGLMARQWNPASGTLPAARHAGQFELVFNRQVARSLGIDLPGDERDLEHWRRRLEN